MNRTEGRSFDELKRSFEKAYACGTPAEQEEVLIELSKAVTLSVLKKLIHTATKCSEETAHNGHASNSTYKRLISLRSDVMRYGKWIDDETIGDGADLVETAISELLNQLSHQGSPNWLDKPISVTKPRKHVYIGLSALDMDVDDLYVEKESTPIQECYKAVRRRIESERTETNQSPYAYVALNDDLDDIYLRIGRCTDIGGYVCDYNSRETMYQVGEFDVKEINDLIDLIKPTDRERLYIHYRLRGEGEERIAAHMNIKPSSAYDIKKRLRKKILELIKDGLIDGSSLI